MQSQQRSAREHHRESLVHSRVGYLRSEPSQLAQECRGAHWKQEVRSPAKDVDAGSVLSRRLVEIRFGFDGGREFGVDLGTARIHPQRLWPVRVHVLHLLKSLLVVGCSSIRQKSLHCLGPAVLVGTLHRRALLWAFTDVVWERVGHARWQGVPGGSASLALGLLLQAR